jgi:uncharacterized membrane protein YedE/YeeE
MKETKPFWNPYAAGALLGAVVLLSFLLTGRGIGASGAFKSLDAWILHAFSPTWAEESAHIGSLFGASQSPLLQWIVFMVLGVLVGGGLGVFTAGRFKAEVIKGPRISRNSRLVLALLGGMVSGYAAQLARGCTSGQAVTGGAQLALGSWIFMFAVFAGAYGLAYFLRRQWI